MATLVALLALAVTVAWRGQLTVARPVAAALRSDPARRDQCDPPAVLDRTWASVLFACGMFVVAVWTQAGVRLAETRRGSPCRCCAFPVLAVIFGSRLPTRRSGDHPDRRILTGRAMTAHTPAAGRSCAA